jgi:hypothetical protein
MEALDQRMVLTSTVFIDFGNAFPDPDGGGPLDPQLTMTVDSLRQTFTNGGIQGPDFTSLGYSLSDVVTFKPMSSLVNFDYNGDSVINSNDTAALQSDISGVVQRAYAPFDIAHATVANSSVSGIRAQLQANNGLSTKKSDAYILIADIFVNGTRVGATPPQLLGMAPPTDLSNLQNSRDDTAVVFAGQIFSIFATQNRGIATGITTAHEAGHTFGLRHTSASSAIANSDQMQALASNPESYKFFTRFPLPDQVNPSITRNAYNQLSGDAEIGVSPSVPHYITGTGLHDRITLVDITEHPQPIPPLPVYQVTVQAYSDAARTTLVSSYQYSLAINGGSGNVLVEMGAGDDRLELNADAYTDFTVLGMGGSDSVRISNASSFHQNTGYVTVSNSRTYTVHYSPNISWLGNTTVESIDLYGDSSSNVFSFRDLRDATVFTINGGGGNDLADFEARTGVPTGWDQALSVSGDEIVTYEFVNGAWGQAAGRVRYNHTNDEFEQLAFKGSAGNDSLKLFSLTANTNYSFIGNGGSGDHIIVTARPGIWTHLHQNIAGNEFNAYEKLNGVWTLLGGKVLYNQSGDVVEDFWFHGSSGEDGLYLKNLQAATAFGFIGNGGIDALNVDARFGVGSAWDQNLAGNEFIPFEYLGGVWTTLAGRIRYNGFGDAVEYINLNGSTGGDNLKLFTSSTVTTVVFNGGVGTDNLWFDRTFETLYASGPNFRTYRSGGIIFKEIYFFDVNYYEV